MREIPHEAHELVLERVCAIDVAKDAGTVCLRLPAGLSPAGRPVGAAGQCR
jgi:hypothetical protein